MYYNMELKITELDTMNPYEKFDYKSYEKNDGVNYWENKDVQEKQPKKKKISFNDILSNMNLSVNKDGILQFMTFNKEDTNFIQPPNYNTPNYNTPNYNTPNYNTPNYNKPNYNTPNYNTPNNDFKPRPKNIEPLEAGLKHSYIYNKYFKDYGDPNANKPEIRVPKTIEEYHQMLLEDKIKAIQHKKMVEEVKSKKMMFTSAPGATSNPRNIKPSINNLRMMNFR
jgi:hypothetical protein